MPGLDPGIHDEVRLTQTTVRLHVPNGLMDRRVKPGDDGGV